MSGGRSASLGSMPQLATVVHLVRWESERERAEISINRVSLSASRLFTWSNTSAFGELVTLLKIQIASNFKT